MRAEVKVEGLRELTREVRKAKGTEGRKAMARAGKRGADFVRDDARRFVTKKSGKTAASIRSSAGANSASVSAGGKRAPGAGPLEYGWPASSMRRALSKSSSAYWRRVAPRVRGIKAKSFLRKAVHFDLPKVRDVYLEELERVLRSISTD